MKTTSITTGERLLIERRRNNESQDAAAGRHGVSRYRYRLWESDQAEGGRQPRCARLGLLRDYEGCYIRRRRAGLSVAALATKVGVSAWWVTQMEHGDVPADRLVAWWGRHK